MLLHYIIFIIFYDTILYWLYYIILYQITLYDIILYLLHYIIWYYTILYHIIIHLLYYVIWYIDYIISFLYLLYFMILSDIILYYINYINIILLISYHIISYHIILYYIILYYIILYYIWFVCNRLICFTVCVYFLWSCSNLNGLVQTRKWLDYFVKDECIKKTTKTSRGGNRNTIFYVFYNTLMPWIDDDIEIIRHHIFSSKWFINRYQYNLN